MSVVGNQERRGRLQTFWQHLDKRDIYRVNKISSITKGEEIK